MSSPNILLTRIDNRLVHGQVGVTWTSTIGANLLVVVDDVVANDDIQQKLMGITAETYGFGIRFFGNDSNLLIVFYVQIMPDDFVMQLHR
ncbi:PTS sugar transporter subunit IIB, partial [Escherichia coli]